MVTAYLASFGFVVCQGRKKIETHGYVSSTVLKRLMKVFID